MKAISMWQPWASLVGRGKSIETRSWSTTYRGPIAIHAAKRWTQDERDIYCSEPFKSALKEFWFFDLELPLGAIMAVATLTDCVPTNRIRWAKFDGPNFEKGNFLFTNHLERTFGNYALGRFGWLLTDIRMLAEPIPYRGAQGLFDVPDDLLRETLERGARSADEQQQGRLEGADSQ